MMLRLTYDAGVGTPVVWEKTAEEFLVPNGDEPLIAWMLRSSAERGSKLFTLEVIGD
jgi:hypothetical protein